MQNKILVLDTALDIYGLSSNKYFFMSAQNSTQYISANHLRHFYIGRSGQQYFLLTSKFFLRLT
jgi:hypothetical protein